jgi:large subunit ribosomal protein L21
MFAVIRSGGKQYRVHPGDKIVVEKLDGSAGDKVTLGDVLLAGDGGSLKSTDGLTVAAEIIAQAKGEKVTVFKKRRRHNYRRKKGHRQQHTILKIVAIGDHKAEKPAKAAAPKKEAAPAAEPQASEAPKAAAAPAKAGKKSGADSAPPAEAGAKESTEALGVTAPETPNPAPADEAKANPQPKKGGSGKAGAGGGKTAKAASTENAAPAKGGAKKSPKAK